MPSQMMLILISIVRACVATPNMPLGLRRMSVGKGRNLETLVEVLCWDSRATLLMLTKEGLEWEGCAASMTAERAVEDVFQVANEMMEKRRHLFSRSCCSTDTAPMYPAVSELDGEFVSQCGGLYGWKCDTRRHRRGW
jgi:hypothetical protein